MPVNISTLAHTLNAASKGSFHPLKHVHALELIAAALGYKSLAAYKAGIATGAECADLAEAGHLVLDGQAIINRATQLAPVAPFMPQLELVLKAFASCLPKARRWRNEGDLYDEIVYLVEQKTLDSGWVSGAVADTNNDGVRDFDLPVDFSLAKLPPPGEEQSIEIEGQVIMARDPERRFSGNKVNVTAQLTLERLGRCAIKAPVYEVFSADLDYDY